MTKTKINTDLLEGFSICADCSDDALCSACNEKRQNLIIDMKIASRRATNELRYGPEEDLLGQVFSGFAEAYKAVKDPDFLKIR